jgi:microcompartment protein CcmK/EutM
MGKGWIETKCPAASPAADQAGAGFRPWIGIALGNAAVEALLKPLGVQ